MLVHGHKILLPGSIRESRLAARVLRRDPAFATIAILTLALGLGATTAVFTLLDRVVLRPLPYAASDQLVTVVSPVPGFKPGAEWGVSVAGYYFFRHNSRTLASVGAYLSEPGTAIADGRPGTVSLALASASTFQTLRLTPALGQTITAADDQPGLAWIAVLSHDFWVRAYGADTAAVGKTLVIDGRPARIVGVLPPGADLPDHHADLWVPLGLDSTARAFNDHHLRVVARLAPGATVDQARVELRQLTRRFPDAFPHAYPPRFMQQYGFTTTAVALQDRVVGGVSSALWLLAAAAALVLAIAATNVTNVVLVRAESRQLETNLRSALGAEWSHLAVMFLAQGVVLATAAGTLGLGLAAIAVRFVATHAAAELPRAAEVHLGWTDLGVGLCLTAISAVLIGILPLTRRSTGRLTRMGRSTTRQALVIGQVALAIVLLSGAGLLMQSYRRLRAVQPGFDPAGVLTLSVLLPPLTYQTSAQVSDFYAELERRIAALPGVTAVGSTNSLPLTHGRSDAGCSVLFAESRQGDPAWQAPCVPDEVVTPGYFAALGIHVRGRLPRDGAGEVIVSQGLADRLWPDRDAIGQGIKPNGFHPPYYHVVGVAENVHATRLDRPFTQIPYYPLVGLAASPLWGPEVYQQVVVRTTLSDPLRLVPAIRSLVRTLDPTVPISEVRTMTGVVEDSMARLTFIATVLALAAGMALVLSVVGLYGVITYLVTQRRAEIGIRMALGARATQVASMVVWQSLVLSITGIAIGVAASLGVTHSLGALLYGVTPTDAQTMVLVALAALVVTTAASLIPARRAAAISPMTALRSL